MQLGGEQILPVWLLAELSIEYYNLKAAHIYFMCMISRIAADFSEPPDQIAGSHG